MVSPKDSPDESNAKVKDDNDSDNSSTGYLSS